MLIMALKLRKEGKRDNFIAQKNRKKTVLFISDSSKVSFRATVRSDYGIKRFSVYT